MKRTAWQSEVNSVARKYFAGLQPIQPKVFAMTPLRTKAMRAFMPIALAGVKMRSWPRTSIR